MATTGLGPFGRLVGRVMARPGHRTAGRVFWVVDNGSSHRGAAANTRLRVAHANAILVHTPVHARWVNPVEMYFSLLPREVLPPNDSIDLRDLEMRIRLDEERTNRQPKPFNWTVTKYDPFALLQRLARREARTPAARTPELR